MAPVRTSGYVPLFSALTSYSAWLWLNCFTSSLTVSPSWPPIACQNEISVCANDAVGLALGLGPAGRPAEKLRHAPADRLGAVEPLAAAGADAGPPQQHVLEGHRQLVLHRVVQLGDDVGVARAQPLTTARELAGEI